MLKGKAEMFAPMRIHKTSRIASGASTRAVNTVDTTAGGRFSGSRNICYNTDNIESAGNQGAASHHITFNRASP